VLVFWLIVVIKLEVLSILTIYLFAINLSTSTVMLSSAHADHDVSNAVDRSRSVSQFRFGLKGGLGAGLSRNQ
jgi:hypothetical protein